DHISFALLTDLADGTEEVLPGDDILISLARDGIENLNEKYPASSGSYFYLFHRPRRWNPVEEIWMGYERKRGKLEDLNALLRGGGGDAFSVIVGDTSVLGQVQYVLTLDTDTQLARDTARQFTAAMAHPLNRPYYDESLGRITRGYGILQPRVAVSLSLTNRSRYETLWAADAGIDPYTRTVSDVYQDLFGEGSFIGKGIYDVDAFERTLRDRFPENRILSHDLLEGCYVRAGLLSDVQLYEEYPTEYSKDVSRRHRWIRGDWQIARWILPSVPGASGEKERNTLPTLCRWKLFDNLRRSVTPAALTLLLLLGWTVFSEPWFWTIAVAGLLFFPAFLSLSVSVLNIPDDVTPMRGISAAFKNASRDALQASFSLMVLPYEAWYSLDAVLRTLWRLTVSKKKLLEWNPASGQSRRSSQSFRGAWRSMIFAPLLSAAMLFGLKMYGTAASVAAAFPVLFLWFVSPGISWWLSQPLGHPSPGLGEEQLIFLRKIARRTWMFFESFVGPEDHWLPPDNYQEHPVLLVAHRTSPTNMGLALLANLTAFDFGYIAQGFFLERTERALNTMEELERFRGHFYNWYDTQTLEPLQPVYISSVDSGNLAGHLLTLRWGLLEQPFYPLLDDVFFRGLQD
ncbi:MAG: cyclic beta 1-2 glucan synthetase, partial [Synergistaceae bacterium]|nr:cyclic beta 1-2 glucan synthetase [Synergistaceae bacterium]